MLAHNCSVSCNCDWFSHRQNAGLPTLPLKLPETWSCSEWFIAVHMCFAVRRMRVVGSAFFFWWHSLVFERYQKDRKNPESSGIFGNTNLQLVRRLQLSCVWGSFRREYLTGFAWVSVHFFGLTLESAGTLACYLWLMRVVIVEHLCLSSAL